MEERNGSANSPLYLQGIEPPQPNGVVGRSGGTTRENGSEASDSDASRARKATVGLGADTPPEKIPEVSERNLRPEIHRVAARRSMTTDPLLPGGALPHTETACFSRNATKGKRKACNDGFRWPLAVKKPD